MRPFAYERAADAADAVALRSPAPAARVPRRRHQPRRPDEARRATPDAARRRHAAAARRGRGAAATAGCGSARGSRNSDLAAHPRGPRALPGARRGAARRRVGAAAQHGHRRRQPAAAHALRVLPGRLQAVQQAPPGQRLPGARGRTPQPGVLGHSEHCVATHPSDMAVALAALDAVVHVHGPAASARCRSPSCTASPATSPNATRCSSTAS